MSQLARTTWRLTTTYSLIFFIFLWSLSAGLYILINNSFGEGYITKINNVIKQSSPRSTSAPELSDNTATAVADIALDRLRNVLLIINIVALVAVPALAYVLSKYSLKPLAKSQKQQQQFVANASHELRTPLAIMSGELELARRGKRSFAQKNQTIENTQKEVVRMAKLVEELLLLARLDEHATRLAASATIDLHSLVTEVIEHARSNAAEQSIIIDNDDLREASVRGNRELLFIAISNLVDNAIKFSLPNGHVTIRVKETSTMIQLTVTNRGHTVTRATLERVFERFYQSSQSRNTNGTGLGLAIVKQICQLHQGNVTAESTENHTTFTLSLPKV